MSEIDYSQINIRKIILKKLAQPSVLTVLFIFLFSVLSFKDWVSWDKHPFVMDVDQYYSYLVAQFIHHDLTFHFPNQFWLVESPTGEMVPKGTMGIALLNLPYFVVADNIAHAFNFETLGYSAPYAWCIHLGAIFYVIFGLWYLRKTLVLFFNEWITSITLILILFGTNLFYYTFRESEMPHSYLFFLFSVFFYHAIKWHHTSKNKHLFYFCFIAGFITLIRPTEILVLLIPLLYKVTSLKELKDRFILIKNLKWKILVCALVFLIPIIPQLIFWKIQTGQFLFFSYGSNEGFFFADPKIYSVLFSWRKGWFIYTPLMMLAIIGLIFMLKKWKPMFYPIAAYILINLYLISSWWDWGFGGAFGMRALVQSYAFMALALAFLIDFIFKIQKKSIKIPVSIISTLLIIFFVITNVFQTWLTKNYLFHWDGMTKAAYQFTFYKTDYTQADRDHLETLIIRPNYDEMRKGNRDE